MLMLMPSLIAQINALFVCCMAAFLSSQINKLRMENEKLEQTVQEMEQKQKDTMDSLASAVADLNNV